MDLEHLNKSQIVLLTLLVSFVTSIATGIVAVTLMQQAPPAITQTVNRIVERTIEKVVPSVQTAAAAAVAPPVTEKTVVVHQSDQLTDAVAKTTPIAVRLFGQTKDEQGYTIDVFLGLGVVATNDGLIFADATMMSDDAAVTVVRSDGIKVEAKVVGRDKDAGIVRLQAATTTDLIKDGTTSTVPLVWTSATFVKSSANLGESVITFTGRTSLKIAAGIVTAVSGDQGSIVETNIAADGFMVGSPLITANGEVLGIATAASRVAVSGGFLASPVVLSYNKPSESTATKP